VNTSPTDNAFSQEEERKVDIGIQVDITKGIIDFYSENSISQEIIKI
jgi:hypothetical protein